MKTYRCTLEVRGYELDSYGHVNHANYLNYLEHARWEALAQEGMSKPFFDRIQLWPIVSKIEVKYLKPALMGQKLEITTRCLEHRAASMVFEQNIILITPDANVPVVEARIHGVTINEQGKPARHPKEMERMWT